MSGIQYVPPSRRLFNSRHRVSRRELQGPGDARVDWSMTLDESIEEDSLISYAVPVIESGSRVSVLSSSSGDSVFEPDLRTQLQSNLSLESLIQENKKRISANQDDLELFKTAGNGLLSNSARGQVSRLQCENTRLFHRGKILQGLWAEVRRSTDSTVLLIEIGKNGLQWFGIPADLRQRVYRCCLYQVVDDREPRDRLYQAIAQCCGEEQLAGQIYGNIRRSAPFLTGSDLPLEQSQLIEARIASHYPGLHYHLTEILKWDLARDFARPLLLGCLSSGLASQTISWELLDVIVFSAYYRELHRLITDEFLLGVLAQTHHKFFSADPTEVLDQLQHVRIDLVELLEHIRHGHDQLLNTAT